MPGRRPTRKEQPAKGTTGASGSGAGLIDARIAELGGWRGAMLARVRKLIRAAEPDVVEDIKWRKPTNPAGVPVWSRDGIICTGEVYKDHLRLTFAKGGQLQDPHHLFEPTPPERARRWMLLREADELDEAAFQALVRQAALLNAAPRGRRRSRP